jgi:hypothetical protein
MITIQELLYNRGLDRRAKIKLVRHQDARYPDLYDWYRNDRDTFLAYQARQGRDIFKEVDYIVAFIGEGTKNGTLSRFIGVFEIKGKKFYKKPLDDALFPGVHFIYDIAEMHGFDDMKERVLIKWSNPISWHQWIKNEMEVIEIHPGLHYKQFTDYADFILSFSELREIVNNQYPDWKRMLSAVKGVYLINDTSTGKLYVGSAYGEDGIWGRWRNYVLTNGHGHNRLLKKLVAADPLHSQNFQFSILMILPRTVTPDEAIKKETLFKKKLGTNSFGLNNN